RCDLRCLHGQRDVPARLRAVSISAIRNRRARTGFFRYCPRRFGAVTRLLSALDSDCRFALVRVARSMSCCRVRLKNQEREIMAKPEKNDATNNLSPAQEALRKVWEDHVRYEFSTRNTDDTLATMVDDAYVNH